MRDYGMTCPRCSGHSDSALAIAKAMEPMIGEAVRAYLTRTTVRPEYEAMPPGLTHAEQKLFSVLFSAAPDPASFAVIFYTMDGIYQRMTTLKQAVSMLRKKLGADYRITYVPGIGYRMTWLEPVE